MNTHTPTPDDEPLDRDERELAALYRQLPDTEPGPELDARVLAEAERAIAKPRRRPPRWQVGLGTAAALVLAGGLAWRLHQPTSQIPVQADFMAPASSASVSARPAAKPAPSNIPPPKIARKMQSPPQAHATDAASESAPQARRISESAPAARKTRAASLRAKAMRAPPADRPAMNPPAPPPPAKALAPSSPQLAPSIKSNAAADQSRPLHTLPVSILVDHARTALAHDDQVQARKIVHAIRTRFPDYQLPDDLARLAPASASSTEHR